MDSNGAPNTATKRVLLASDHAGEPLKRYLASLFAGERQEHEDLGVFDQQAVDYADLAHELARGIAAGTATAGILVCGTGLGMSMAANRHPGIRAAVCHDAFTAEMARRHNDANVLCLGARVIGIGVADQVVRVFLATPFDGGRHQRRIDKIEIDKIEKDKIEREKEP